MYLLRGYLQNILNINELLDVLNKHFRYAGKLEVAQLLN
jgi:hypothetical protein